MGAEEFDRWCRYFQEEPWGVTRDNFHAALIASTIANVHRGKKSRAFRVSDFMLLGESARAGKAKAGAAALAAFFRAAASDKQKRKGKGKKHGVK